jgi:hypothetical protein
MVASTLTQDRMEDVAPHAGDTPGLFQLYTPTDKELTASFLHRAEQAGYRGVVITLDTWTLGWRPRDLNTASHPFMKSYCLQNYFTDDVFLQRLAKSPQDDPRAAAREWNKVWGNSLRWEDLTWLRSLTTLPILLKGIQHPDDVRRAKDYGVDGIYCSNHGGRQANGGVPALDALPKVVEAAEGMPVLFDSGAQRLRCRQSPGDGGHSHRSRPPIRVRTCGRRHRCSRVPVTRCTRRTGPAHGDRRLPHDRGSPRRGRATCLTGPPSTHTQASPIPPPLAVQSGLTAAVTTKHVAMSSSGFAVGTATAHIPPITIRAPTPT